MGNIGLRLKKKKEVLRVCVCVTEELKGALYSSLEPSTTKGLWSQQLVSGGECVSP